MSKSPNPIIVSAQLDQADVEETALRGIGQSLELHHRLNEVAAIKAVLDQPCVTSLQMAKDAVQKRISALLVLQRQLQRPSTLLEPVSGCSDANEEPGSWN